MAELRGRVADERVLRAVRDVPRDVFVPDALKADAWANEPLPIGCGQTISQPLVVARMCELLELTGEETVLDVGTGSGYHAAILARLARHVYSIEVHEKLSRMAAANLVSVFNPEIIVFGGGIFGPAARFLDRIHAEAKRWAQPIAIEQVRFVASTLGGDAGLFGAGRLAMLGNGGT